MKKPKHYMLISCAVLARESYYCAAISNNLIDVLLLEQGLHDIGEEKMSAELQKTIDSIDIEKYDAILLGYGLCNNGVRGLNSELPLVIPRAHDCITLLMGSKERYKKYFDENPGTYYKSTGWIERCTHNLDNPESTTRQMGMESYQEYVEKYGEENAKFLMETLEGGLNHYDKLTYIDPVDGKFPDYKKEETETAKEREWKFEEYKGDSGLLQKMLDGEWDENDFLILNPGEKIVPTYDEKIIDK